MATKPPSDSSPDKYLLGKPMSFKTILEAFARVITLPLAATVAVGTFITLRPLAEIGKAAHTHLYKAFGVQKAVTTNSFWDNFQNMTKEWPEKFLSYSVAPFIAVGRYAPYVEKQLLSEPDPYGILPQHSQERLAEQHARDGSPGGSPSNPTGHQMAGGKSQGILL